MKTMILVILTAAITNNYVLVKFLGICPFLGVSKKLDQATGMSLAVIFVEVLATAVTWPIYHQSVRKRHAAGRPKDDGREPQQHPDGDAARCGCELLQRLVLRA